MIGPLELTHILTRNGKGQRWVYVLYCLLEWATFGRFFIIMGTTLNSPQVLCPFPRDRKHIQYSALPWNVRVARRVTIRVAITLCPQGPADE